MPSLLRLIQLAAFVFAWPVKSNYGEIDNDIPLIERFVTWGSDIGDTTKASEEVKEGVRYVVSNECAFAAIPKNTSKVVVWGDGECGGNMSSVPAEVNQARVSKIFASTKAFAALREDGRVLAWGSEQYGGNTTTVNSILNSRTFVNISSNSDTLGAAFVAIDENGLVTSWGDPVRGGRSTTVEVAVRDAGGAKLVFSTATAFTAITKNGSVISWGDAISGGDSTTVRSAIDGLTKMIYSNNYAFAALRFDGSVVAWGNAFYGGRISPNVSFKLQAGVTKIFANSVAFAALKENGEIVTWGSFDKGGVSDTVASQLHSGVKTVFSNTCAFAALKHDHSVVTWGESDCGGDSSYVTFPDKIVAISSSGTAFAALSSENRVVPWGRPSNGGNAAAVSAQLVNVKKVVSSCCAFAALTWEGAVITWGSKEDGGDSFTVSPELLSGISDIYASSISMTAFDKHDKEDPGKKYDNFDKTLWVTFAVLGPLVLILGIFACCTKCKCGGMQNVNRRRLTSINPGRFTSGDEINSPLRGGDARRESELEETFLEVNESFSEKISVDEPEQQARWYTFKRERRSEKGRG